MDSLKTLKSICQIITEYMELQPGDVYIYNQKYILPNDTGLKVCVGIQGEKIYHSSNVVYDKENVGQEEATINKQMNISIDIYSYDMSAMKRKDEIIMAFNSSLAENVMNRDGFHIGVEPVSVNSISELENTKILNRFTLMYNVITMNKKVVKSNFYNNIETEIVINN